MNHSLCLLILLLLISSTQPNVLQITLNNLRHVLSTYEHLHILFHNPQCAHSRKYTESFLKIGSEEKLGIVDCLREIQLCKRLGFQLFPVVARFEGDEGKREIVDEQQFLVKNQQKNENENEVVANRFVSYLQQQPYYAVVVFQDYGLPVVEDQHLTPTTSFRTFYLQPYHPEHNPSNLTRLLSSFVNNKPGCWIFKKSPITNELEKYFCDSGYNKTITLKFIKLFTQNKIKRFVFSQEESYTNTKETSIKQYAATDMYNIIERVNRVDSPICTLIYISSAQCPSCRTRDLQNVQLVLRSLQINTQIAVGRFDVDHNEIPKKLFNLGLKRVPELVYACNQKLRIFGGVFFLESLKGFLEECYLGKEVKVGQRENGDSIQEKKQNGKVGGGTAEEL